MNYEKHPKMKYIYIGIDTHKYQHTACLINCFNEKLGYITFDNDSKGFNSLIKLVEEKRNGLIPIYGLEDTKHLGYGLATFLLNKNFTVKSINSSLTAQERKKYPISTKNDELDSECIAKVLLDNLDTVQNAENEEIYWTLKQIVKMRSSIVKSNTEYKNKLHAQLLHHYPNYQKLFTSIFCPTALALFEKYPSPDLLLKETEENLRDFIIKSSNNKITYRILNGVMEKIKECEILNQDYQCERNSIILLLIKQIKNNQEKIKEIDIELINLYNKIGKKIHTFPCLTKLTSAYILAEIGNINRFSSSSKLAKYAGIAPIDFSSGGNDKSFKNKYGNRELNSMIYAIACRSLSTGRNKETPFNSIFLEYYQRKCNTGKTKHQAIVCVMRRIINIIYFILKNDKEYHIPIELAKEKYNSFLERKKLLEDIKSKK